MPVACSTTDRKNCPNPLRTVTWSTARPLHVVLTPEDKYSRATRTLVQSLKECVAFDLDCVLKNSGNEQLDASGSQRHFFR